MQSLDDAMYMYSIFGYLRFDTQRAGGSYVPKWVITATGPSETSSLSLVHELGAMSSRSNPHRGSQEAMFRLTTTDWILLRLLAMSVPRTVFRKPWRPHRAPFGSKINQGGLKRQRSGLIMLLHSDFGFPS